MTQQRHIAVLTGDIVGSTALGAARVRQAMQLLAQSATHQADWHGNALRFTQHRGDGWQVALYKPELALRSALAFYAAIRSSGKDISTRIAAATGPWSGTLQDDLNTENQPPFIASGTLLQTMTRQQTPNHIQTADDGATGASFTLASYIAASWTPAQAQAMAWILMPQQMQPGLTQIGKELGKSRQAVTKSIEGAGGFALIDALTTLEKAI